MIDEERMIREITEVRGGMKPDSIEDKILKMFLQYIKGQKKVDAGEYIFLKRMEKTFLLLIESKNWPQAEIQVEG